MVHGSVSSTSTSRNRRRPNMLLNSEISYTIRYPELKTKDGEPEWVLRQSAIYQRFNTVTLQNLVILFSPTPDSKASKVMENHLVTQDRKVTEDPFYAHGILFSTYFPAWRQYIAAHESQAMQIVSITSLFCTNFDGT